MEDTINSQAGLSLAKMTVGQGVTSELHHHMNCTETIHLLEGVIEQRIGQVWKQLEVGDIRAVMMIAYSTGKRVYVAGA